MQTCHTKKGMVFGKINKNAGNAAMPTPCSPIGFDQTMYVCEYAAQIIQEQMARNDHPKSSVEESWHTSVVNKERGNNRVKWYESNNEWSGLVSSLA